MKNISIYTSLILLAAMFLTSCYSKKNIVYFYDLKDSNTWSAPITNDIMPKFQKDDRISVKVVTIDQGTTNLLNSSVLINSGASGMSATAGGQNVARTTKNQDGYIIDSDGNVFLPYVGKIKAEGLTKEELTVEIKKQISRFVKDPIVYVDWLNFKYTVIGKASTNVYEMQDERLSIIQAIAKAGDFSTMADMQRVMLIREEGGKRNMVRLNFQDSDILNSPYYYIQQNDIIYIEPKKYADETAQRQISNVTMVTSLVTLPITLTTTIMLIVDRLKK